MRLLCRLFARQVAQTVMTGTTFPRSVAWDGCCIILHADHLVPDSVLIFGGNRILIIFQQLLRGLGSNGPLETSAPFRYGWRL